MSVRVVCSITAIVAACAAPLFAQLPATRLASVYPAAGNPGQTFDVVIAGDDLDDVASLQFTHPGITAKQKMREPGPFETGPQPVPNTFEVTVAANAPLGAHEVRAVGRYGVSNPRTFHLDRLPGALESEPNNEREQASEVELPAAISGRIESAADVDHFRFTAPARQRIILDCLARRIDSRMDAVVVVYDPQGRELASSRDARYGDPLVDITTPAAGEYTIKVYDAAYQGGPDYFYRIRAGVLPYIDYVFPPAAAPGNQSFTVFGRNLPGGQPANVTIAGRPLEQVNVTIPIPGGAAAQELTYSGFIAPATGGLDGHEYRIETPQGFSNPALIGVASATPVTEQEPNNEPAAAQKLTLPCEVMGRFSPERDRDWFQFEAKKDQRVTIAVIAQRMGFPANPVLLVQQVAAPAEADQPEQVNQLALVRSSGEGIQNPEFDLYSSDPVYDFTAPADGVYRLLVRDSRNALAADPRQVYRLAVRADSPDFRLAATPERSFAAVQLRKGGQAAVRVTAYRLGGFDGEIKVTASGLPQGVTATEAIIGPAANMASLVLTAAGNAPASTGAIEVSGVAQIDGKDVARKARYGAALYPTAFPQGGQLTQPMASVEARLAKNLVVSVSEKETAPAALQAGQNQVYEVARAGILKIPYTRSGAFAGKFNLAPHGLPPNVNVQLIAMNAGQNQAEYELRLQNTTPVGTYSFTLWGYAENHKYQRNPEAAEAAQKRKVEVDEIKAKADADAKAAADAKTAADRAATETAAAVQQATNQKNAAQQALEAAESAAKTAAEAAAAAKSAAAANADDANLQNAAKAAETAAAEATAKVKEAADALAAAEKGLAESEAKAKTAAEAKMLADEKATETAELAQAAAALKTQTDQRATQLAQAAQPRDVNVPVVSTPITINITPAPVTVKDVAPLTVKQGEKVETMLAVTRLYGFNDPVSFNVTPPQGVGGLSIPNVAIPAGQTQIPLAITAGADAPPGEHTLTLRTTMNYNGQQLTLEQPLTLTVQEADDEAAK
jgi:hypothetical protein